MIFFPNNRFEYVLITLFILSYFQFLPVESLYHDSSINSTKDDTTDVWNNLDSGITQSQMESSKMFTMKENALVMEDTFGVSNNVTINNSQEIDNHTEYNRNMTDGTTPGMMENPVGQVSSKTPDTTEDGFIVSSTSFALVSEGVNSIKLNEHEKIDDDISEVHSMTTNNPRNQTEAGIISDDYCKSYGTCNFVANNIPEKFRYCHCDELCSMFDDCCWDANVTTYPVRDTMKIECVQYSDFQSKFGNVIIRGCPSHYSDEEIMRQCKTEDILASGPWVLSEKNIIYQNRYCAECNQDLVYRAFSIDLSNIPLTMFDRLRNKTSFLSEFESLIMAKPGFLESPLVTMTPPEGTTARSCMIFDYTKAENIEKCLQHPINPIYVEIRYNKFFARNGFCKPKQWTCIGELAGQLDFFDSPIFSTHPLSVMFPFTKEDSVCENEVSGLCLDEPKFSYYPVEFSFLLSSPEPLTERFKLQIGLIIVYSAPKLLHVNYVSVGQYMSDETTDTQFIIWIKIEGFVEYYLTIKEMLGATEKVQRLVWYIKFTSSGQEVYTVHTATGANGTALRMSENYSIQEKSEFLVSSPNSRNNYLSKSGIQIPSHVTSARAEMCERYYIECDLHRTKLDGNFSLKKISCLGATNKDKSDESIVKKVLTITGLSISMFGLILTLIVNRRVGIDVSVHGSNIQNLTFALVLSNILSVVGIWISGNSLVCYYIGVSVHYLWLVVCSFMTLSLLYAIHNLRKVLDNRGHEPSGESNIKYTVIGLVLPLLIVIPVLCLESYATFDLNLKYNDKMCFPTGFPGAIIFFFIPIGISVLVNAVCVLNIAVEVGKHSFRTTLVRNSSMYHSVLVLGRITVLTGIFWIAGILNEFLVSDVMGYIFVGIYSVQGAFIAAVILLNQTIRLELSKVHDM